MKLISIVACVVMLYFVAWHLRAANIIACHDKPATAICQLYGDPYAPHP